MTFSTVHIGLYGIVHEGFIKSLLYTILRPRDSAVTQKYLMVPHQYGTNFSLLFVVEHASMDLPSRHIIFGLKRVHCSTCSALSSLFYNQSLFFQNSRVWFQLLGNLILFYLLGTITKPLSGKLFLLLNWPINLNYIQLSDSFYVFMLQGSKLGI